MTISFNKNLYPPEAIKETIKAYKGVAVFKIRENKNNIEVSIDSIDNSIKDVIGDEFCNYVLAETKKFK